MSEEPKREGRPTPPAGWSLPLAYWQDEVAQARERVQSIASEPVQADAAPRRSAALDELSLTFEELSVAEEELRAQNAELERAQAALVAEHTRYRELFEHAPVPYLVTDAHGVVRAANDAAGALLQANRAAIVGRPIVVFARDASRRRMRAALRRVVHADETMTVALKIVDARGHPRRIEATMSAARDLRGIVTEIRWLLVDRTTQAQRERRRRRRQTELERVVDERTAELRHAQDLKDQLLSTVSHEFRTALTAIGGYAELLEIGVHGELEPAQLGDVRRIHGAYKHLAIVVDDLLSFGKLTSGRLEVDITHVLVADALRGLSDMIAPQAMARHIAVEIEPIDPSVAVRADVERLRQVLLNLLTNAVKFTPTGGRVVVRAFADADWVSIEVADSGEGIPEDAREAIFEPFVRLPTQTGSSGTGLGLPISRDLARAMGGDVTLSYSTECGSCFVVRLARSTPLAP